MDSLKVLANKLSKHLGQCNITGPSLVSSVAQLSASHLMHSNIAQGAPLSELQYPRGVTWGPVVPS